MGITFHQLISVCFPETIEQYMYKIYTTKIKPRETLGFFFLYNENLPPHKPIILQEHCTVIKFLAERPNDI